MQTNQNCEETFLKKLASIEDLAEKKAKIYSRLLMDAALADDMEKIASRHEQRKEALCSLACGKAQKSASVTKSEEDME